MTEENPEPGPKKPAPKRKENIIPELIERNFIRPLVEAHVAFVSALTKVPHTLKSIEINQDENGQFSVPVKVSADFSGGNQDYLIIEVPMVIPMPRGTIFEKEPVQPLPPATPGADDCSEPGGDL